MATIASSTSRSSSREEVRYLSRETIGVVRGQWPSHGASHESPTGYSGGLSIISDTETVFGEAAGAPIRPLLATVVVAVTLIAAATVGSSTHRHGPQNSHAPLQLVSSEGVGEGYPAAGKTSVRGARPEPPQGAEQSAQLPQLPEGGPVPQQLPASHGQGMKALLLGNQEMAKHLEDHFGVDEALFKELFAQADKNDDGILQPPEEHELFGLLALKGNWTPPQFNYTDSNGDGVVQGDELENLSHKLGFQHGKNHSELESVIEAADADGDERLNVSEFKNLLITFQKPFHRGAAVGQGALLPLQLPPVLPALQAGEAAGHGGPLSPHAQPAPPAFHPGAPMFNPVAAAEHGARPNPHFDVPQQISHPLSLDVLRKRFGVNETEFEELFALADSDDDGTLQAKEAQNLVGLMMQRGNWTPPQFNASDTDGDGAVEGVELKQVAPSLQHLFNVNDTEYQLLMSHSDADGDGQLTISEFKSLMGSLKMRGHVSQPQLVPKEGGNVSALTPPGQTMFGPWAAVAPELGNVAAGTPMFVSEMMPLARGQHSEVMGKNNQSSQDIMS